MARRCCCGGECFVKTDDFQRATVTGWNQVTGTWEIIGYPVDGELHELAGTTVGTAGTANAKLIYTTQVPAASAGEMSIGIWVKNPVAGDVFRIYPCCTTSSSTYSKYAEYTKIANSPTTWKIEIVGATEATTQQWDASEIDDGADKKIYLWCCADRQTDMIVASVSNVGKEPAWAINTDPGTGRYAGIGHNNSATGMWADDFYLSEIRMSDHSMQCADCWCWCENIAPPKALHGSFTDGTDRLSCLTETWNMDWQWNIPDAHGEWYGELTIDRAGHVETMLFTLACNDVEQTYPGSNWELTIDPGSGCFTGVFPVSANNTSTCGDGQPGGGALSLVFGPFSISDTNFACYLCYDPMNVECTAPSPPAWCSGTVYITITE